MDNKRTTIYLHTFQTVLDMNGSLMTIHTNEKTDFYVAQINSVFFLFSSLSWWLKIWMILCLHKKNLPTHFVAFSVKKSELTKQKKLWSHAMDNKVVHELIEIEHYRNGKLCEGIWKWTINRVSFETENEKNNLNDKKKKQIFFMQIWIVQWNKTTNSLRFPTPFIHMQCTMENRKERENLFHRNHRLVVANTKKMQKLEQFTKETIYFIVQWHCFFIYYFRSSLFLSHLFRRKSDRKQKPTNDNEKLSVFDFE